MAWGLLGGDMLRKATVDTTDALTFQGNSNAPTSGGVTDGLTASGFYNNSNTPCSYSNVINIKGDKGGCSQLALGWSGSNNGIEHLYYRNKRDCCDTWSEWRTVAFTTDTVANANYASVARGLESSNGQSSIYSGNDTANGPGGSLNNLVINSWYGVSFTSDCQSTYQGKTAVGIDCREGIVKAAKFEGSLNGNADTASAAVKLCNIENTSDQMSFHNTGITEQNPTWYWGSWGNTDMYRYRTCDLSVNYANSAGSVNDLTFRTSNTDPGAGSSLTNNQVLFVYE